MPWTTTQRVCHNYKCALEWNRRKDAEAIERLNRKYPERLVIKPKSYADHNREAQNAFNRYIRIRDSGRSCCACGVQLNDNNPNKPGSFVDASHYRSRNAASHLRFNVFNCVSCCWQCNRTLSGNIENLRVGLIERFGHEIVDKLNNNYDLKHFDIKYLIRIKNIFTRRADHLLKIRSGKINES